MTSAAHDAVAAGEDFTAIAKATTYREQRSGRNRAGLPAVGARPGSMAQRTTRPTRARSRPGDRIGDVEMPNAVYERTRVALTGLLPGRAATTVLDRALARQHRSSEDVGPKEMAAVLMKGVYGELKGVLPDPGLRRALRRVARDVAAMVPRGATTSQVRAARERIAASAPAVAEPTPALVAVGAAPSAPASGVRPSEATRAAVLDPDRLLARLVEIDGVHGVGRFDGAGRPLQVRGRLPEPDRLGGFLAAAASLLERRDALRTVTVEVPNGRLVAVPTHPHWLALTGAADLNLGAVYAALSALEEER